MKEARKGAVRVAVIGLPHISNFTDFDPFESDEDVDLRYVAKGERIGRADVVIIPGTKSTLADLGYVREEGYEAEIKRHLDKRGTVVGICGGYQMLGRRIIDPDCVEGGGRADGLGLLGIETVMKTRKATHQVEAIATAGGYRLSGYEIHMGDTAYVEGASPLFLITLRSGRPVSVNDGAVSLDGRVWGTYMHGIFENDCFRRDLIERVKTRKGLCDNGMENIRSSNYRVIKEEGYRRLAARVRASLDMEKVYGIAGLWPATG